MLVICKKSKTRFSLEEDRVLFSSVCYFDLLPLIKRRIAKMT